MIVNYFVEHYCFLFWSWLKHQLLQSSDLGLWLTCVEKWQDSSGDWWRLGVLCGRRRGFVKWLDTRCVLLLVGEARKQRRGEAESIYQW